MNDPESPVPAPQSRRSRFSSLHKRTYELELLQSGAVVFGLIHLPPILTRYFESLIIGLDGGERLFSILLYAYSILVVYGLIIGFLLHLVMRGFWIGLLGLESVFPQGIIWERVKLGPIAKRVYQEKIESLARNVDRVDELSSLIFSVAFMVVSVFVYSVIVLLLAGAAAFGISTFLGGQGATAVFLLVVGALMGCSMVSGLLDQRFGGRATSDSLAGRFLERLVRFGYLTSPARLVGATSLTLQSHLSSSRVATVTVGVTFGLATYLAITSIGGGGLRFDSLVYFPGSLQEQGMDPRHYRSLRASDAIEARSPSIQSELVAEPYLKLFIPYHPRRHNPLIATRCPELGAIGGKGLRAGGRPAPSDLQVTQAAVCFGSLFEIFLDGVRIDEPTLDFTVEPGSDLEGVVSFISVRDLAHGRHELEILAPTDPRSEQGEPPEPDRHLIPFWL